MQGWIHVACSDPCISDYTWLHLFFGGEAHVCLNTRMKAGKQLCESQCSRPCGHQGLNSDLQATVISPTHFISLSVLVACFGSLQVLWLLGFGTFLLCFVCVWNKVYVARPGWSWTYRACPVTAEYCPVCFLFYFIYLFKTGSYYTVLAHLKLAI